MKITITLFITMIAISVYAAKRSALSPAQLVVGEWRNANKHYEPSLKYPKSREYFTTITAGRKTGVRSLKMEDEKTSSLPYSILKENKKEYVLEISLHLSNVKRRKSILTFDKTGTKMLQRMYITNKFHIDTYFIYVGGQTSIASPLKRKAGAPCMVRVAINDDTKRDPVNSKAEIWFRGYGSWWLKPELKYGGTFKNLGSRLCNIKQILHIYPDSRNGKELQVSYMMTKKMNPKGSPRDMINVDISDTQIKVYGLPIKAANDKFELIYKR